MSIKKKTKNADSTVEKKNTVKKVGIKKKLLSIILPLLVLVIAGLIATSYVIMSRIMTQEAENTISKEASANSENINLWVEGILGPLSSIKGTFNTLDLSDENVRLNYLKSTMNKNDSMKDGVYATDDTGYYMFPSGWKPGADWVCYKRDWYKEGKDKTDFAFGTPYLDQITGKYAVTALCNTKTYDGKQIMLATDVILTNVSEKVGSMSVMNTGYAFLVDTTDNTIIAHKNESYNAKKLSELSSDKLMSSVNTLIKNNDNSVSKVDTNNGKYFVKLAKISNTNWELVNCVSVNSVMAELYTLQRFLIIIAVILVLVVGVIVERTIDRIIKPIGMLTDTIVKITDGDFTIDITNDGNDEVAEMSRALKNFILHMRETFGGIQEIAADLSERASSSAASAELVYSASSTQSESMAQMRSAINDIAQAVQNIAENATNLANAVSDTTDKGNNANDEMDKTVSVAGVGSDNMKNVQTAMNNIVTSMSDLEHVVEQVEKSTEEINGIIGIISEIAEQTNLLSLNASIEAARAGESGRGFAVVATEIGKLASDSSAATEKIAAIIKEITDEMSTMVDETKLNMNEINDNSGKVNEAETTFESINEAVNRTGGIIGTMMGRMKDVDEVAASMAAISEEQSASTEEMLATTETIASSSQKLTDDSKSLSESAEVLTKSSEQLKQYLSEFKLV